MKLARATGIIRRRILLNYRIAPDVVLPLLPPKFRPKLHGGFAIGGICLIRLEQIRPTGMPAFLGRASENAAHRFAVLREDGQGQLHEAVYVVRRDTNSRVNRIAGGRIFPGEYQAAKFEVKDDGSHIDLEMHSEDKKVKIEVHGKNSNELPRYCGFKSPEEASSFFKNETTGYSATEKGDHLEAIRLRIEQWKVQPLELTIFSSSYFDDRAIFPESSILFDCALIMRDTPHEWVGESELYL